MQIKVKHLIEKAVKYKKDSNPNALKRKEPYLCLSPFEVGVKRGEEVEALMAQAKGRMFNCHGQTNEIEPQNGAANPNASQLQTIIKTLKNCLFQTLGLAHSNRLKPISSFCFQFSFQKHHSLF